MAEWYEQDPIVEETQESDTSWFENDDLVSSQEALPTPTAEELEAFSEPDPRRANLKQEAKPLQTEGFTPEEASTIPMGDMTAEETVQFNRDSSVADQYKDYQGGNVIDSSKEDGIQPGVRKQSLGEGFEVTTDMYQKSSNPKRLYELLTELSDETDSFGRPMYKGRLIPHPAEYEHNTATSLLADTARESIKETAKTAGATIDELTGGRTDLFSMADSIADPPKAEKLTHQLGKDAIRVGGSALAGTMAGSKLASKTNAGEYKTKVIQTVIASAVEQLTNNPEQSTLMTGDNALVEIMAGVPIDENGRPSAEYLDRKANHIIDSIATAGVIAGGADLATKATKMANNLVQSAIAPFRQGDEAIAKQHATELLKIFGAGTPEEVAEFQKYLRENAEVTAEFADGSIKPATIKRTSMSAITKAAEEADNPRLANAAMEQEKIIEKGASPGFSALKQQPIRELSRVQKEAVDSRGGYDAIDQTKNLLANKAISDIDQGYNKVTVAKSKADDFLRSRKAESALDFSRKQTDAEMLTGAAEDILEGSKEEQVKATQGLQELFQKDQAFAKSIDELSRSTGIDVGKKFRANATDDILPDLVEGVRRMKQKKNDLYTVIPDDADIDEQSFLESLQGAIDADALPLSAQKVLTGGSTQDISAISEALGLPETTVSKNTSEPLNFGQIYKMLPKINKAIIDISNEASDSRDMKLQALHALRDNINDVQMQYLVNHGDKEVKKAAQDAVNYYKNEYIKFARDKDTPIGSLFDAYDRAFDDHFASGIRDETTGKLSEIKDLGDNFKLTKAARDTVKTGLDYDAGLPEQVSKFVKHEDTGIDSGKFLGPYKGKVLDALNKSLEENGGDFSKIKPYDINKALEAEGVSLTKHFPDDTQKINDFIEEFKVKKGNVASATEQVDKSKKYLEQSEGVSEKLLAKAEKTKDDFISDSKKIAKDTVKKAEKRASSQEQEVWRSALGKFIEKSPDGTGKAVPAGNGYVTFRKMLNSEGNESKVKAIADQIKKSGDKDAQKGLEAAMFEYLRETLVSDANSFKTKGSSVSKLLSDSRSLNHYGKVIFNNSSDPVEAAKKADTFNTYLKLVDLVNKEQLRNVSTTAPFGGVKDTTAPEAKKAVDYIIGVIYGRFNPTSMKLSSTAGRVIYANNPAEKRAAIISALHEDPEYLADIMELVKGEIKKPMSSEFKRALVLAGVLTGRDMATENVGEDKPIKMPEGLK